MTHPDPNAQGFEKKKSKVTVRLQPIEVPEPEMVLIPAQEFLMGTSDDQVKRLHWKEDWAIEWYEEGLFRIEQPQHIVSLPSFEIGKYPVTNAEYYRFIWQSNHRLPKGWVGFRYPEGMDHHPVTNVSKKDAEAYCEWLSAQGNNSKIYRLPNEAEWEYAARGVDGRMFPWGDDFDPWRCNTLESRLEGTAQVEAYSPAGDSPFGLCCMAGNVAEWTTSRLLYYPYNPEPDEPEPGEKLTYVVRGGAWYYSRKLARCAAREAYPADKISPAVGFRIARSLED